ncbi:type I polyketide synthase [Amycolatopsis sp. CA-230715]|uniref:type I polyketide synthase n=1 Tax=Amycolatopsis sp. CA-230715 TaxID=2745196 RepID=UPI001C02C2C7|nr:type I polyketide synthase [Amycolatopsis sp. CA-230715]QWF81843.1 hypothetical protein HUW46_05276 [Amycolatopsis sp. CA-230715]
MTEEMTDAIAIVGAGCRMPGAPDLGAFWRNLRGGLDTLTRFDAGELLAAGLPEDLVRRPEFVPVVGLLPGGENFDWRYFGYSPAEAGTIDPQQRIFLEVCLAALQDAAIDPARFPGWIGVFAGCDTAMGPSTGDSDVLGRVIGTDKDFLATRVAYKLGLTGPAITVQTACSTSLVAAHQACQSLRNYECDVALAGGSSLMLPQTGGYLHQEGHVLSADGRCRSFDAGSTGTVPSNGAGAVVLRRLEDALADGDRIMAVLRGSAVNNDGGEKIGYTAPSLTGQRDVVKLALGQSEVDPDDIVHIEGHGTATPVGDPIEVAALTAAFRASTDRVGYCWLGSVKSNIGHTSAAAGIAGLIKTALMLEHRELVPALHFEKPNPRLELGSSPFKVITENQPLPDGPAYAGVSSFGIGGTNAHAVLETPPQRVSGRGPRVFCLAAPSETTLSRARADLAGRVAEVDPVAAAWTLVSGRPELPHRVSVVAEDLDDAVAALRDEVNNPGKAVGDKTTVAFVFPGHGTLYPGAAAAAYGELPVFRELFDEATELARKWGVDLTVAVRENADPLAAKESMVQQIGLFAIGYALGKQLLAWDIRPSALLGQSLGEYVAAALAGLWDLRTGLEVVAARALAIEDVPTARMLAVYAEPGDIAELLDGREISVATEGPGQLVLGGSTEEIERLAADLSARSIDNTVLGTPTAGHTELMRPVGDAVAAAFDRVGHGTVDLPVVSNLTGKIIEPERLADPGYWAEQMCRTVRLTSGMGELLATGCDVVLELGPAQTMIGGLRRHPAWTGEHTGIALLGRAAEPRRETLLGALGRIWESGLPVGWDALFVERPTRCSLPPVPLDSRPLPVPGRPEPVNAKKPAKKTETERAPLADLWCRTLGVPSADPEDNFFRLGGESLGLVRLLGQVREETGVRIAVADLLDDPTFGRLLALVGETATTATTAKRKEPESPNLVRLNGSAGTPLFLAASGTGSSLCYRHLAPLLGESEHAVYGLEAPGLHDGAEPLDRFEALARENLALLKSVQPTGPYRLGGWSLGAMLAHEMARQLLDEGERVETLLCIDGFVPWTRGLPIGTRPGYLAGGLWSRAQTALGRSEHVTAALRLNDDTSEGSGKDTSEAPGEEYVRVYNAGVRAVLRYVPRPLDCAAVVFKTGLTERTRTRVLRATAPLYLGGVRVVGAPGDHWSVLGPRHVDALAEELRNVLAEPGKE